MSNHDTADIKTDTGKRVDQPKDILVIGNTQVSPAFILLDRVRTDHQDDLGIVFELQKHLHFAVGLEARKDAGGVIIVKKFAAEFQI